MNCHHCPFCSFTLRNVTLVPVVDQHEIVMGWISPKISSDDKRQLFLFNAVFEILRSHSMIISTVKSSISFQYLLDHCVSNIRLSSHNPVLKNLRLVDLQNCLNSNEVDQILGQPASDNTVLENHRSANLQTYQTEICSHFKPCSIQMKLVKLI